MDFLKKASQSFGGNSGDSGVLQQAEGFLQNSENSTPSTKAPAEGASPPPAADAPPTDPAQAQGSENYSELYGSAQTLYQGLQDKLSGKQSNIDDQQLAGAAENVLQAADQSGFVKDSPYAGEFNKAETYLQGYNKDNSGAPASGAPARSAAGAAPLRSDAAPADSDDAPPADSDSAQY